MPVISIPIPEINHSIIRPTVLTILEEIKKITGIKNNVRVIFKGLSESVAQFNSTIDGDKTNVVLNQDKNISIEIENNFQEDSLLNTPIHQVENPLIFNDINLGINLKPIISRNEIIININYRSDSRTQLENWRNELRLRAQMNRNVIEHVVDFHYPIPEKVIAILKVIHSQRESTLPYGDSFAQYLQKHSDANITAISNLSGTSLIFAKRQKQSSILGFFDFEETAEKIQKEQGSNTFTTTFSYKFYFDCPVMISMRYPIMIHNEILPNEYLIQLSDFDDRSDRFKSYPLSALMQQKIIDSNKSDFATPLVRIPEIDFEFRYTSYPPSTRLLLSVLCSFDLPDKHTLLNLKELGDYEINPIILDLLKDERDFLLKPYKSIFQISMFVWSALSSYRRIEITNDLDIRSIEECNPRNNHRIGLFISTDLSDLDRPALKRLKKHKEATKLIFKLIGVTSQDLIRIKPVCDFTTFFAKGEIPNAGFTEKEYFMHRLIERHTVQTSEVNSFYRDKG